MHMILAHETSLFCGKPPGRPPDPYLVRHVSHHDAPFIDPGGMGGSTRIVTNYYVTIGNPNC